MWVYPFHLLANEKSKKESIRLPVTHDNPLTSASVITVQYATCICVCADVLNAGIVTQMIMSKLYRWVIYSMYQFSHYSQK